MEVEDWSLFSPMIAEAALLVPFMLDGADEEWFEVAEQLQAIQWGLG